MGTEYEINRAPKFLFATSQKRKNERDKKIVTFFHIVCKKQAFLFY